jgi:N-acetylmuramoyl-L-alanine amidase
MRFAYLFGILFFCTIFELAASNPLYKSIQLPNPKKKIKPSLLLNRALIIIDPGHGGEDEGAQSITKPRYREKSLNLATAKLLHSYLRQLGYRVLMTRNSDIFISLIERAELANKYHPDLFVSVHYNSAPSAEAHGIEVFYYLDKEDKHRAHQSKKLGQHVLKHLLIETDAKSRGVKHANYAVIRETNMPAILIEGGFLTNAAELEKIKEPAYQKKLAWGAAKGIDEYLSEKK